MSATIRPALPADVRGINFVFEISTLLPLLGIVAAFLPDLKKIDRG